MKIAVIIPAYHRPLSLLTLLGALKTLASDENEIECHIGIDHDDIGVIAALEAVKPELIMHIAPPAPTIGQKTNDIIENVKADAYCWLADDVLPVTPGWDRYVNAAITNYKQDAFCWQELGDPNNTAYPVVSGRFLRALGGKLFSEYFPFWFVDTWLAEVCLFSFGRDMTIVQNLPLAGKRGKSNGLRDLRFWFDFFAAMRPERLEEARRVRDALDLPAVVRLKDLLHVCQQRDRYQLTRCADYERIFGINETPQPRYLVAKARAEKRLAEAA